MFLGMFSNDQLAKSAFVAYIHYLSIVLCFGSLLFERLKVKVDLNRVEAISIVIADSVYGIAGLSLLVSGILRVKYFGNGSDFYIDNPIFWVKVSLYIFIGVLSLYPTFRYLLWVLPLRKNKLPDLSKDLVDRLQLITTIELIGFAVIPFFASLMARGIGLN
tara:strand:- start:7273 stop:7758 length:486 start_codon:yes stop_codon:yes gene_type:complete